jgi:hypothetical protein
MNNDAAQTEKLDFGSDGYIWKDGQRLRVSMVRTVQPMEHETNSAFEHRMDGLVAQLSRMPSVLSASFEFEKRGGSIVLCTVHIVHKPMPDCIAEDNTPAGGRHGGGNRGKQLTPNSQPPRNTGRSFAPAFANA